MDKMNREPGLAIKQYIKLLTPGLPSPSYPIDTSNSTYLNLNSTLTLVLPTHIFYFHFPTQDPITQIRNLVIK